MMECNHEHHFKHRPAKATRDDICNQAVQHYERLSDECHSWFSVIPKMIEFYREHGKKVNKMGNNVNRSDIMNGKIDELSKRVLRLMYDALLGGADLQLQHKLAVASIDDALVSVNHVQRLLKESRE